MAERRRRDYDSYGVPTAAIFVGGVAAKNLAALGETRPSKALALADKLRRSGASPDTIHAETSKLLAGTPYAGVHYGRDGKPRFEVSDEGARVRKAGLDKSGRGFMGDFVEHPELYKALPEAQLLGVEKANFRGGGYDGRTIHIGDNNFAAAKLAGRPLARDSARGVALHELQHYAQDVEGFAPGASPDDFKGRLPGEANRALREAVYRATAGEVEAENARARRNMTAEQRRASPPSRTETVPVSEQHLGPDEGRGMVRQFGGELPKGYSVKRDTNSMGQTNYKIMRGRSHVGDAYVRDLGNRVQVGRISISKEHQRKGISTALYAQIERDLGKPVVPDATLSEEAFRFWKKHRPDAVAAHKPLKSGGAMDDPYGYAKSLYADSESSAPETGGARTGVRRIQRMVEKSPSAGRKPRAPRASKAAKPITDLRSSKLIKFDRTKIGSGQAIKKGSGWKVVDIDVAATEKFYRSNPMYVADDATGGHANRIESIKNAGKPLPVPILGVNRDRSAANLGFDDGRHRFAAARQAGMKSIPVAMDPESIRNARALGILVKPDTGARVRTANVKPDRLSAAVPPETSGLRGTQNPANLAAIVENRQANAATTPALATARPSADLMARAEAMGRESFARGGGSAPAQDPAFMKMLASPEGKAVRAVDIMKAWSQGWTKAHAAAPVAGVTDAATVAADQKRADERFKQVLDDTERKVATAKAGSSAAPKEQPDLAKAANAKLPRGYGVYSRARAAGLSHDAALAQTAETLAKTTDRKFSGHADADGLRAAYEQAHTDSTSHAAARTKATKLARPSSVAIAKFEYDPERVQRFKQAFPKAKFNPTTKEWSVAGVTAQKRIDKWVALDADATAKTVLAEAKARDAAAFDGIKVNHPYVTAGKTGYAVRTPYDPALVKILKGLPGARWNPATKAWDVPMRSADALNARLPDIEKIAAPMVAREQEVQRQRQAQRDAQRVQWDKEKAAQKAKWTEQRAAEDARMAQVRSNRYLELSARNPKVGDTIRIGGKAVTVESIGKMFRADESTSSVSRLIGVEGERVNYVYHRAATAAEVATLESVEAAAKAAAQARKVQADALGAMRDVFRSQGEMPAKMDTLPTGRAILSQGNHNRIYGGGEDYILRGKSLYQVMGNSADGDDWSRSNAPGSIVKKVSVTPDLLATMRAATGTPAKGIGFQNEANLNAALLAQGKSEVGKAQSRAVSRTEFMAAARATPLPGGGYEVTAPDGNKVALPNAGTEAAAKITAFARLGSIVNKVGAISMIAAPTAAAYVAYTATKDQANAAGRDGTAEAIGQAAVAGGTVAGIGYAAMKTIGGAMKIAARVAPKVAPALGPVGIGIAVAGMGYGAYQGYKRHGLKGAALGSIGADMVLDAPTPGAAPAQPVHGRLSKAQQAQFATANAAYAGMQAAAAKDASDGMTADYTRTVNGQTVEVRGYKTPKR